MTLVVVSSMVKKSTPAPVMAVMDVPVVTPTPPPAKAQKEKKGFFGKLRSFFGGMFK